MEGIRDARSRGKDTALPDPHGSMDLSNGTAALGAATGLGEVPRESVSDMMIGRDLRSLERGCVLFERRRARPGTGGGARERRPWRPLPDRHSVMQDALDQHAVYRAIAGAGLRISDCPSPEEVHDRVINVFAKCEADPRARLRGRRQVMLDDSDVHHHRHAKAALGAVVAAAVADPAVFVSVGAMHQGPPGGGPVAAIVRPAGVETGVEPNPGEAI